MKYKITKKEMKENYYNILGVEYCELQNLLKLKEANSYCAGVYGWACDNYELIGSTQRALLVSTGYNPIKTKNIERTNIEINKIIKEYEAKAEKIKNDYNRTEKQKRLDILVRDFVDDILKRKGE